MYEDMGYNDAEALSAMVDNLQALSGRGAGQRYASTPGWRASRRKSSRAESCWSVRGPAIPTIGQCRRATILNMYTDPPFRRQGIARRLMQTMIDWCRKEGFVRVDLHASDKGRPLYESLGFEPTN